LHLSPRSASYNVALFDAVKPDGFVDGKNLVVDDRGFGLRVDELADHASAIVKAEVDLIVCSGDPCVRAAQRATKILPILALAEDMVRSGFVASLAKPGGNTTGVSILTSELNGKRQEILLEVVPGVRRMAVLADANSSSPQQLQALKDAARERGVEVLIYPVTKAEEIANAINAAKSSGVTALNVLASAFLWNNRQIILPRVAALGLVSRCGRRGWLHCIWHGSRPDISKHMGSTTGQIAARGKTCRHSRRATEQIRLSCQSQNRRGAWIDDPGDVSAACRQSDRMIYPRRHGAQGRFAGSL
jgi:hypothetical protein